MLERLGREGRAALAVDLPGFGRGRRRSTTAPMLPQYDRFVAAAIALRGGRARAAGVVLAGNSLGGCLALRAAQRDELPIEGIVPVAPAGLDMPAWFSIIQRDVVMRALLSARAPLPERVVRRSVGEVYRRLAFARPGDAPGELVSMFTSHHPSTGAVKRLRDLGARLLPGADARGFELERIKVPVLLSGATATAWSPTRARATCSRRCPAARYEELPAAVTARSSRSPSASPSC